MPPLLNCELAGVEVAGGWRVRSEVRETSRGIDIKVNTDASIKISISA